MDDALNVRKGSAEDSEQLTLLLNEIIALGGTTASKIRFRQARFARRSSPAQK